jgi:hypothetical protein
MTSTVSQPTVSSQDSALGNRLPRTPNAARDSTIVGAEPRLPARATQPQSANETTTPTTPAITPCQKETPNPSTKAPYATPSTEMLAANHGQNRSAGLPLRSPSAMTLIPLRSIAAGIAVAAGACSVSDTG